MKDEVPVAEAKASEHGVYELPLQAGEDVSAEDQGREISPPVSMPMLLQNALWFCRLRWLVAGSLLSLGIIGLFPRLLALFGINLATPWPLGCAAFIAVENLCFLGHLKRLTSKPSPRGVKINLWAQIVLDLIILTAVVHFAGSLETAIAFAYLFHIVLACIFFPRKQSFWVTLVACVFFSLCVALETLGVLRPSGLINVGPVRKCLQLMPLPVAIHVLSIQGIWIVVWHLTSRLSASLRQRESELASTNRRLEAIQREKTKHMVRTTHELKSPFSAIQANAQLLLDGYSGTIDEEARTVVSRINERSLKLADTVREMLQLAMLESEDRDSTEFTEVNLNRVIQWSVGQVEPLAQKRKVALEQDLEEGTVLGIEDQLSMLMTNLLTNAITYSNEGGTVRAALKQEEGRTVVSIEDEGIGIPGEKLPLIFKEHFRTDEAVKHNPRSTGLGLAIVRRVAQIHGIRIRVVSQTGAGTRFQLSFSPAGKTTGSKDTKGG